MGRSWSRKILLSSILLSSTLPLGASEEPNPPLAQPLAHAVDVLASTFGTSAQQQVAVEALSEHRLAVVWSSRRQDHGDAGIFGRLFDPDGRALSGEVRLHSTTRGRQSRPVVAPAPGGGAWIAWESIGHDSSARTAVVARRFASDLGAAGEEIRVAPGSLRDASSPTITSDSKGRALVAWSTATSLEPVSSGIYARWLLPEGTVAQELLTISQGAHDLYPATVALPGDRALITWARLAPETDRGIFAAVVDASGPVGEAFRISPKGNPSVVEPSAAATPGGGFAVAWMEQAGDAFVPVLRRFDKEGSPLDPEPVRVPTAPGAWASGVSLASDPQGRLLLSFNSQRALQDRDLFYQRFGADGAPLDPVPRSATIHRSGNQSGTIASGARRTLWLSGETPASERLVFAWRGDAGAGDADGAHLSLHAPRPLEQPVTMAPPLQATTAIPTWNPSFVPLERLPPLFGGGGDFGFEAVPDTGWNPPDPEIAVGPTRIVVMTNGAISTFDKQGTEIWSDEIENSFGFWGELGTDNFVFDPEVTWDPHAQRFVAMANERSSNSRSNFLLAVSRDQEPTDRDDWHKYRLDVTDLAGNDIDSPNLALNREFILLTADFFGPDKYLIYIIDKDSILEGGAPVVTSELITGASQQSMGIPVVTSDTDTLFILQSTELSNNTSVIFHAITDPFTNYLRQTFELTVPDYTFPASPPQMGSSVRPILFEPRFWSVAESNGAIWAVHHVGQARARVRWYSFDLNGWPAALEGGPTIAQTGEIDLGDGISTFFPSIDVDSNDNAAITFARSAINEFISIGRTLRAAGDPPDSFRPPQVVQASLASQISGRWGDYSGTQNDPDTPGTFWGHHEFTTGSSSWRTWVARYDLRPAPMLLRVSPPFPGATADLEVTGATPGDTVFFYATDQGTGLTEVPGLGIFLSLENGVELGSAVADLSGVAQLTAALPAGAELAVQAAEDGHTSNWVLEGDPLVFADGFESGDVSAWSAASP